MWVLTDDGLRRIVDGRDWAHPLPRGVRLTDQSTALEDRDGNVWIGAQNGLVRFRDGRFDIYTKRRRPARRRRHGACSRIARAACGSAPAAAAWPSSPTARSSTKYGPPGAGRRLDRVGVRGRRRRASGSARAAASSAGRTASSACSPGRRAAGRPGLRRIYPGRDGRDLGRHRGRAGARGATAASRRRPWPSSAPVFSLYLDRRRGVVDRHRQRAGAAGGRAAERVPGAGRLPRRSRCAASRRTTAGMLWVTSVGGLGRVIDGQLTGAITTGGGDRRRPTGASRATRDGTLWFGAGTSLVRRATADVPRVRRRRGAAPGLAVPGDAPTTTATCGSAPAAASRASASAALDEVDRGPAPAGGGDHVRHHRHAARDRRPALAQPGAWKTRDGRLWFATAARRGHRRSAAGAHQHAAAAGADRAGAGRRPAGAARTAERVPARAGQPRVPLRRRHPAGAAQGAAPLPAGGLRRATGSTPAPGGSPTTPTSRPGRYRFRVQASNADGVWNEAGATPGADAGAALLPDRLVLRAGGAGGAGRWRSRCTGRGWRRLRGAVPGGVRRAQPGGARAARFAAAGDVGGGAGAGERPQARCPRHGRRRRRAGWRRSRTP